MAKHRFPAVHPLYASIWWLVYMLQSARGGVRLVPSPTWRPRGARRDAAQQRRGRGRGSPVVFFLTVKVLFEQARLCLAIGKVLV